MDAGRPLLAQYANWFNIGHNNFEFVLDFGQFHAEELQPLVHTRIVAVPSYAKTLARLLNESLCKFEAEFGPIPDADGEEPELTC